MTLTQLDLAGKIPQLGSEDPWPLAVKVALQLSTIVVHKKLQGKMSSVVLIDKKMVRWIVDRIRWI